MQYRAFISHSHADTSFAAWLQRSIETWRVPSHLRAQLGYSRIKPVFRDRTDLRAASSLGDSLEEALRQSAALIVVCSNEAAASDWVGMEIARYREFNPDAPVVAIIASGEPPHCFPEPLLVDEAGRALEPLAADSRKGFDGKRDALLKTIAAIIDVDFDTLKRRDFRRRQQRMGVLTALATGVAAVTLNLAYLAYEARDDANRRREQADELVSFMLGDLRYKLEPIGRLDILDDVGDEALKYFAALENEDFTAEVELKHGTALTQIGEVHLSQGRLEAAQEALALAYETLQPLASDPDVGEQAVFAAGQSRFWSAYAYYEIKDYSTAREGFLDYLAASETLMSLDPGNADYQRELQFALSNLGVLEMKANEFAAARSYFNRVLPVIRERARQADDMAAQDDLQNVYSWFGETAYREGKLEEAASWAGKQQALLSELARESNDRRFTEYLCISQRRLAFFQLATGAGGDPLVMTADALSRSRELQQFDTSNYWWQFAVAGAAIDHSYMLSAAGRTDEALETVEAALPEVRALTLANEDRVDARGVYLELLGHRARLLVAQGVDAALTGQVSEALAETAGLVPGEVPLELAGPAARLHLLAGDQHHAAADSAAAVKAWQHALALLTHETLVVYEVQDYLTRAALLGRLAGEGEVEQEHQRLLEIGVHPEQLPVFTRVYTGEMPGLGRGLALRMTD